MPSWSANRDPYGVTVGGGVEAQDESVEAALHREVFEELGGTVEGAELVYLITDEAGRRHRHPAHLRRAAGVDGPGRPHRQRVRQAGTGRLRGGPGSVHRRGGA
ncbi:NUDIX hydrolase [Streptomyces ipomoeae]|nr:NUDIX hydrolase [Streptomyces ipomoeae]